MRFIYIYTCWLATAFAIRLIQSRFVEIIVILACLIVSLLVANRIKKATPKKKPNDMWLFLFLILTGINAILFPLIFLKAFITHPINGVLGQLIDAPLYLFIFSLPFLFYRPVEQYLQITTSEHKVVVKQQILKIARIFASVFVILTTPIAIFAFPYFIAMYFYI